MQPTNLSLGHVFLTLQHHVHLISHISQPAQNLSVPIFEFVNRVLDACLITELAHQSLDTP